MNHVRRAIAARLVLALSLIAVLCLAWWDGREQAVGDVAVTTLPCVSYAPFRRHGHTPFAASLIVTPAQIEADLRRLATLTRCIRLYGTSHGLTEVPAIARQLGLRVVLGAWLSRDEVSNAAEIERVITLARAHADIIDRVIVGNEVLLRRELDVPALARWLDHVRARVEVPVSYADVWEFWLRNDQLRQHVDVITAHVLPYWEDDPVPVDHAVGHVRSIHQKLQGHFAPTPIWIGETGWPAAGRQRAGAKPGLVAQTRFVREMSSLAAKEGVAFNLIEGFDQPWKRALEGRVGSAWGVFDAKGQQRLSWRGAVQEDVRWWHRVAWAIGTATVAMGIALMANARPALATKMLPKFDVLLAAALLGATVVSHLHELAAAHLSGQSAYAGSAAQWWWISPLLLAGLVLAFQAPQSGSWRTRAVVISLFAAACWVLPIVVDGRYRDLPWLPLIGAAAVVVSQGLRCAWGQGLQAARRVLAAAVCVIALALMLTEGGANQEAWLTAFAMALLGAAALVSRSDVPAAHALPPGEARVAMQTSESRHAGAATSAE